jgi:hypothetical protein
MAEEGMTDFALAKQKAARQSGLTDAKILPDNREIEEALRDYQGLYQSHDQPIELRRLREAACEAMRELSSFRPFLVGAVLNGTANQYSEVTLQLFADDCKALALFLVNRGRRFDVDEKRVRLGDDWRHIPQFVLEIDGVPVRISVYASAEEHRRPRPRADGDTPPRASLAEVEALLGA